jgi:hypothetical protein
MTFEHIEHEIKRRLRLAERDAGFGMWYLSDDLFTDVLKLAYDAGKVEAAEILERDLKLSFAAAVKGESNDNSTTTHR